MMLRQSTNEIHCDVKDAGGFLGLLVGGLNTGSCDESISVVRERHFDFCIKVDEGGKERGKGKEEQMVEVE